MEIKIYREPENTSLMHNEEDLESYNQLMSELGLKTIAVSEEAPKCPNVYICVNSAMKKQLKAVCPSSENAEKYTRSTIPLEVLRAYKFAKDNAMYTGFEIWYDDVKPDPLLLGYKLSDEDVARGYTWNKTFYLIARWGDCALELPDLLQLGFERMKQSLIDQANEAIERAQYIINNPDMHVRKALNNQFNSISINL